MTNFDEVAERFPSVRFGQKEWVAVFDTRPDVCDAILAACGVQANDHPPGQMYGGTRSRRQLHWYWPGIEDGKDPSVWSDRWPTQPRENAA